MGEFFRIFNGFWTELDNIKKFQDVFKEFFIIAVSKFKVIVEFFMSFSVQAFFNVKFIGEELEFMALLRVEMGVFFDIFDIEL